MELIDYIVIIAVAVCFAAALTAVIKKKKHGGCCGCSRDCEQCRRNRRDRYLRK